MVAATPDGMDLEAMRMDDNSWHPCCISLSSADSIVGIIVDFGNGDEEEVIHNKEDALSRLRFRSTPLQGDECINVKEGDYVLALQKTQSKSFFIDATIVEPKIVKHSKRVHCRCTFEIKWLNSELKGETVTLPSKSILKFSDRRINEHPVFSSFLMALSSENGHESPSTLSISEESSHEAEFVGILEKQVEEISKLVDGSIPSFTDLFLEVESANIVKPKPKPPSGHAKPYKDQEVSVKRTTRSQSNIQIASEVAEEAELIPVLSPLAARAALASLVHDLPEKSYYTPDENNFLKCKDSRQIESSGITELSVIETTTNSVKSSLNAQNSVLSYPNSSSTVGKVNSYVSSNILATPEKKMEASKAYSQTSRSSANGEKTKTFSSTRRLTRSMQKETKISSLTPKPTRKEALIQTIEVDILPTPNSPSFELEEEFASDNDDDDDDDSTKGEALSKLGSTNGTGSTKYTGQGNKMRFNSGASLGTRTKSEEPETRKSKPLSTHVDSTSETDSSAQITKAGRRGRKRLSREVNLGANMEDKYSQHTVKRVPASLKNVLKTSSLRSSPRFALSPMAGSQAKS